MSCKILLVNFQLSQGNSAEIFSYYRYPESFKTSGPWLETEQRLHGPDFKLAYGGSIQQLLQL